MRPTAFQAERRVAAPLLGLVVVLGGCATAPSLPDWTSEPARAVDNGYIVYTGSGQEGDPNEAQLAAEGTAIQDLANECSFVPKGARVEDHFRLKTKDGFEAYARVAVDFETCESAQHAVQPDEIKKLASAPFADELKRYQDLIGAPSAVVSAGGSAQNPGEPPVMANDEDYFLARQYVFYQKQVVILAPPGAYAPGSVETQVYLSRVAPVIRPMQAYYAQNPRLRSTPTTWSAVEPQVRRRYPHAFKAPRRQARAHKRPKRRPPKKKLPRKN
jgi:hypothetical protein